ncbi:cytochrome c [Geomonas sp.]|uniref:c-type cytochrome n=1 Tax=Geomonas sp. TaxID=2651584 RepID=UPI002B462E33|nr:cytochrome c [Geomonas sp.]HJV37013.1 cytochrome c [Geomonas sp.]
MPHKAVLLRASLVLLLLLATVGISRADAGKELFDKQCASCHSIGGGDGGGPDLKGVGARRPAAWLVRVIVEPDKLTAEKDPTQAELVKKFGMEMPNLGVSADDAKKIVAFLGGKAAPAGGDKPATAASGTAQGQAAPGEAASAAAPAEPPKEVVVTPVLVAAGRDLFNGKVRFANGGAPCVSCHGLTYPGVTGGALAADLTDLYKKMGENGVRGVLKTLAFPVMKKAYADRPLTEQETTALIALFKDASAKKHPASDPYPLAGLGFFGVCLVGLIIFKRRIG